TPTNLKDLRKGDCFIDGKFIECDGEEIPVIPDEKENVVRTAIEIGDIAHTSQIKLVVEDGEIPDDGPSSGSASEVSDAAAQAAPVSTDERTAGDRRAEPERSWIPAVTEHCDPCGSQILSPAEASGTNIGGSPSRCVWASRKGGPPRRGWGAAVRLSASAGV